MLSIQQLLQQNADKFQYYTFFIILPATYFLLWFYNKNFLTTSTKKLPPSPPKLPILGNIHQITNLPHRGFWKLSKKHGPLMLLQLGCKPTLVVSSAEASKMILKTHDLSFSDRPSLTTFDRVFYGSKDVITIPYGTEWKNLKSIMIHKLMNGRRVRSLITSSVEDETALVMEKIKHCCLSSLPINLSEILMVLIQDIICKSAFGVKYTDSEKGRKFLKGISETLELLSKLVIGEFFPWLAWINKVNGCDSTLNRIVKERDEFLDDVINENLDKSGTMLTGETFIGTLLGLYNGETHASSITKDSIKAILLDVIAAGTLSSATTIEWGMTELIRHPDVMKKLQDEIRGIMNGRKCIIDSDLEKMQYLKVVIKEIFRHHPPVPLFPREAREDVNMMGYNIPARASIILLNTYAINHDPVAWDEPELFKPERFVNSSIDFKGFNFELIPFGSGRRVCPGLAFAAASIEHIIANLVYKFDWVLPDGAKPEELDMTEKQGIAVGRKSPLLVVAPKCYF
ncbi:hypothetical protein RD792_005497 [Penstemon davidsonii]|uniref:Cytochrome P450 n=2 Tax=Penstemon davidsonii TaxID=160366 RepID=A0ABR0DG61_9LAMI|nr:hypothetical protein RD792_005497 [Penstemon davidsonii]